MQRLRGEAQTTGGVIGQRTLQADCSLLSAPWESHAGQPNCSEDQAGRMLELPSRPHVRSSSEG
jgi:hypothetical protein